MEDCKKLDKFFYLLIIFQSIINVEGLPESGPISIIISTEFLICLSRSFIEVRNGSPARFTEVVIKGMPDFWIIDVKSLSGILIPIVSDKETCDKKEDFFFFRIIYKVLVNIFLDQGF